MNSTELAKVEIDYHRSQMTKGDRTRLRLLEAAVRTVSQMGFEGASVIEIGKAARVNRSLVTHYFGSKAKLEKELFEYVFFSGREHANRYLLERKDSSQDPIQTYIEATFEWFTKFPTHGNFTVLMIQKAGYDRESRKKILRWFEVSWERVNSLIKVGRERNQYRKDLPATLGRQIHSALIGALISANMDGNFDECLAECLSTVDALIKRV